MKHGPKLSWCNRGKPTQTIVNPALAAKTTFCWVCGGIGEESFIYELGANHSISISIISNWPSKQAVDQKWPEFANRKGIVSSIKIKPYLYDASKAPRVWIARFIALKKKVRPGSKGLSTFWASLKFCQW